MGSYRDFVHTCYFWKSGENFIYCIFMIWEKRFHRLISLATFAMASVLGAQTRWDKVALSYTNQCNVYSVEISGVNDTCFSSFETEFVDQNAEPVFRTLNKKFNIFFGDTGTYYGTTLIKNKCNRDDTSAIGFRQN